MRFIHFLEPEISFKKLVQGKKKGKGLLTVSFLSGETRLYLDLQAIHEEAKSLSEGYNLNEKEFLCLLIIILSDTYIHEYLHFWLIQNISERACAKLDKLSEEVFYN